jgi:hypothetical protein
MSGIRVLALLVAGAVTMAVPVAVLAQDNQHTAQPMRGDKPEKALTAAASTPVVYKPPLRGAPGGRVGGGTRGGDARSNGADRAVFMLSVLAPDHTGLTISEQPSLYWYISSASRSPVEVTVVDPRETQPLLRVRLSSPLQAGVHRIRFADHGIRLEPDITYRWYVAVVPDANRRAKDFLTGGAIQRVASPEELQARLATAGATETPSIYAEAGLWYDALAAVSALIDDAPDDSSPRRMRAALLEQVGLAGIEN